MKFYLQYCTNPKCQSFIKNEKESHKLTNISHGEWFGECQACGKLNSKEAPAKTMNPKKKTYPYEHAGSGETFVSEAHEKAYIKKNNIELA